MLEAAAPTTVGARAPTAAPGTIAGAPTPLPAGAGAGVSVEDAEPAARGADQEGAAMGVGTQVGTVGAVVATEVERAGLVVLMGGHRGCLALSSLESARHFSPSSRIHGVRAFLGPSRLFFFRGFCTARVLSGAMLELSCAVNGTDSPAPDVATLIWAGAEELNSCSASTQLEGALPNSMPIMFHAAAWQAVSIAALQSSNWGGSEAGSAPVTDDPALGGTGGGEAAGPMVMLCQLGIEARRETRWSASSCIWALIRRSSTKSSAMSRRV